MAKSISTMSRRTLNRDIKTSAYRSACKLCEFSIYAAQPAVWLRRPAGLSHTACAQRAGLYPKEG